MDFTEFSKLNLKRSNQAFNHSLESWSYAEWTNAMAGEFGEALDEAIASGLRSCNTTKKLLRYRDNVAGNLKAEDRDIEVVKARVRKEIADAIIYADLAIQALGGDTSTEICEVFNAKSRQLGSEILITSSSCATCGYHDCICSKLGAR